MGEFLLRYVDVWLRTRAFRVRLTNPEGRYVSNLRPTTRGTAPGRDTVSVFLITHIDRLCPLLLERRETGNARLREVHWAIFTYADDVVTTQAHEAPTCLVEAVDSEATDVDEGLGELGLSISAPKSNIVTLSPGGIAGS